MARGATTRKTTTGKRSAAAAISVVAAVTPDEDNPAQVVRQDDGQVSKADVKARALAMWSKLADVVDKELSAIQQGDKELSAAVTTSVVGFMKMSADLWNSSADLSPKDAKERTQVTFDNLPTFPDDEDEYDRDADGIGQL